MKKSSGALAFLDLVGNKVFLSIFGKFLERVIGKVHILVTVGDKPAIEILFERNEVILDIKNPILALEAGLEQMLSRRGELAMDSRRLEGFKKMGYKLKIRYRGFEHEL